MMVWMQENVTQWVGGGVEGDGGGLEASSPDDSKMLNNPINEEGRLQAELDCYTRMAATSYPSDGESY